MGKRKDPNQKGSGARKHRRNYRLRHQEKYRTDGVVTRYRAAHNIPAGSRRENHRKGICPMHKAVSPRG